MNVMFCKYYSLVVTNTVKAGLLPVQIGDSTGLFCFMWKALSSLDAALFPLMNERCGPRLMCDGRNIAAAARVCVCSIKPGKLSWRILPTRSNSTHRSYPPLEAAAAKQITF